MNVLGLDTSGTTCSVAFAKDGMVLHEQFLPQGTTPSKNLLTTIDELLQKCSFSLSDLDGIAITTGPGSFTSLRVGICIVKGLAWTHNIPIAGINTLDGLAYRTFLEKGLVCPVLDARQKQVYTAIYKWQNENLTKVSEDLLIYPADLAAKINEKVLFLGQGVKTYKNQLQTALGNLATFADNNFYHPQAAIITQLGSQMLTQGQSISAVELTPYYLRRPAAEINKQRLAKTR